MAPWCSGPTRHPVKVEIGSSNLLGVATIASLRARQLAGSHFLRRPGRMASSSWPSLEHG